ncbi:hypothetical protein EXIGLDRAFT_762444 [Exidia glandulosa HHB12029]|uniref:PH domain-like protein n=1 Tax=Exidia glandulosa HHB12029 TaxID=1314781 RepID=A0A165MPG8_EXIGL|nr:hypothetical protein EXIGLDRAFT_762444 [Exidia glandulosa HHB12029]
MAPVARNRRGGQPHLAHHPHPHAHIPRSEPQSTDDDDGDNEPRMSFRHAFESTLPSAARYHHNLKTIRRQDPSVLYVFHQFSYMQIFIKNPDNPAEPWSKSDTEGPMFILRRSEEPKYALLLLNRYGTENFVRPLSANDTMYSNIQVLVQWKSGIDGEVLGFWCKNQEELAEFKLAVERIMAAEQSGRPYVPDVSFVSSATWAQDQTLQSAREHLLEGLLQGNHSPQPQAPRSARNGTLSPRSATPPQVFREPEDDDFLDLEADHVAGPNMSGSMTAVDSLFAKLVGPSNVSTPTSLPSAFGSPIQTNSHAPARAHPSAPAHTGSRDKERKGRELLDQLFASAMPAPTPPPPAPEHRSRMRSPQAPQPQVLNPDVLQMLLGFRSTPHVESEEEQPQQQQQQQQQQYLGIDEAEPEGARTPVVVHQPIPQRVPVPQDPHVNGSVDREAVVDAAADLLSRRLDPVLRSAQDAGLLDKNTFGRRLVELIHTDKQFMVDLHQEYLRRV